MNKSVSTIDSQEINKFAQLAAHWWSKEGPLKTLHDINQSRLAFIQQHAKLEGASILDVGCGGGILSEALATLGGFVVGLDAETDAIDVARAHAREASLAIAFECTAIEEYEHAPFDLMTCMEMLEHVAQPQLVLQHCQRLLKPGGMLFLSTINRTVKAYANAIIGAEYILNLLPKQTHDYRKFIKPSELIDMGRKAGFELVDMKGLHYNPFTRKASLGSDVSVNYVLALRL